MPDRDSPRYHPPVRLILRSRVHLLAFGFGTGLAPFAPGTFGTLVGIPLWLLLCLLPVGVYAGVVLTLFVGGCWLCGRSAKLLGVHDHPGIVFDEVVGFLLTAMPLLPALHWHSGHLWLWLLAAFLLFRLFDILKPPPIRWLDRHVHGGFGIMLDDAVAAIPAALLLMLAERLIQ